MNEEPGAKRFKIKKYSNRRFYDVTRSCHVTLTDLYELVQTGHEISVEDSSTGDDITNVVLTQIILEHDPPKMDLFPSSLLHQAIQANQQMVRKFIDRYFAQAMDAFVRSRRQFDAFLQKSGFSALTPTAPFDWVRMLFPNSSGSPDPSERTASPPSDHDPVEALREQMASINRELEELRTKTGTRRKKRASTKTVKRKKKATKKKKKR
ncbi:MAG: polyhydroxyalkanoate synthesis regulator DNA-binding domain-containing protein [Phycisphaerales bacterium]|nr:polyhydroxyalkanoate synthesis regulator DNA-binding domain-containing protein [Phycisphaerales bacterium]